MSEVVEDLILPEQEVTVNEGTKENAISVSVSVSTQVAEKETDLVYLKQIDSKLDLILENLNVEAK
ncbi:hypothetical protein [uncultured Clostridium sp.]|uniref:hypothetical protein n=1 Tax=uncultured Clostridium sp. TaxID=59620 RepID=UPI0025E5EF3A|nr:hypothetical protein [uncultured Clostridium sp.]